MGTSRASKPVEMVDVVDPTGAWLGTETRAKVHADGLWHNVFHCLVVRSDQPCRVLLQRRAGSKTFPNMVDLSATGHLMAGEEPADGVREIAEELGISIESHQLVPVGVRLMADNSGEGLNRERIHLYFVDDDRPIDAFVPAPDEVSSLVEIEVDHALHLLSQHGTNPSTTVDAVEWVPGTPPTTIKLAASELVPPADGYWATALVAAKRFANSELPIAI